MHAKKRYDIILLKGKAHDNIDNIMGKPTVYNTNSTKSYDL